MTATVNLQRLRAVVCRLIDELEFPAGSNEFLLPENDSCWRLSFKAKIDMTKRPQADEVGCLRDDWELTHRLVDVPEQVSARSLTEVAELLSYLGYATTDLPFRLREEQRN